MRAVVEWLPFCYRKAHFSTLKSELL
jgi:hypothetical protein